VLAVAVVVEIQILVTNGDTLLVAAVAAEEAQQETRVIRVIPETRQVLPPLITVCLSPPAVRILLWWAAPLEGRSLLVGTHSNEKRKTS
jgi:hypothetical protein